MTPEALQEAIRNGSIDSTKITDVSVFNQSADPSACTDGKDDGSIGLFDAIGSALKGAVSGVVNGIKGCFFDENGNFSLGNTLKTALTVGACFIPGVGPVVATGLCALGAVKGGIGVAKGVAAAATADTDAEARAAFESIGANGVATAASAVGLKASVGALASNVGGAAATANGTLGKLNGIRSELVTSFKQGVTKGAGLKNAANTLTGGYYGSAWGSASGSTAQKLGQVAKSTIKDTGSNIYKAYDAAKTSLKDKTDKITGKKGTADLDKLNKKFSKEYGDIPEGDGVYKSKDGATSLEVKKVTDADGNVSYEYSKTNNTGSYTEYNKTTTGDKTTYTKDKTSLDKFDSVKNKKVEIKTADGSTQTVKIGEQLKNPGDTFTAADGTQYSLTPDNTVLKLSSKATNKLAYDLYEFKGNAMFSPYTGVPQTGYPTAVAKTVAADAISNEAQDMVNDIPNASQTLATVDIQSGYEYDLEDYSIMNEDQVNKSYSTIMSNAYGL